MSVKIANNQNISNLREEIKLVIRVLEYFYELRNEIFEIFWTTGGKHSKNSLHYKRRAIDFNPSKNDREGFIRRIRYIFGKDYDILDEGDHFHIEWDPK